METSTLLSLMAAEGERIKETSPSTTALLYSAAEKIKALEAHKGEERRVTLDDLADLKRAVDAGRGPGAVLGGAIGVPALRL